MRLDDLQESSNVEDRRGSGFSMGRRTGGLGLGSIIIAAIAYFVFGINPLVILGLVGNTSTTPMSSVQREAPAGPTSGNDEQAREISQVLRSTEEVWTSLFSQAGAQYRAPKLVLFRGATPTACGAGQAAMGPFYCPGDQKVYIDLSFYETLQRELGAPGEFARAYVIAHEVGHHIQNLLGLDQQVAKLRGSLNEKDNNAVSVRVELQADCYAGIWAKRADDMRQILEKGDIEAGLNAAAKIGDDTLQRNSQGYAVPESFTHGTSQQRMRWFSTGFQSGDIKACNTFAVRQI